MSEQIVWSVSKEFKTYPENIWVLPHHLRELIFNVAHQENIDNLEETLK